MQQLAIANALQRYFKPIWELNCSLIFKLRKVMHHHIFIDKIKINSEWHELVAKYFDMKINSTDKATIADIAFQSIAVASKEFINIFNKQQKDSIAAMIVEDINKHLKI